MADQNDHSLQRILIVEDDDPLACHLADCVSSLGYGIAGSVRGGAQAVASAADLKPDLVLLDMDLSGHPDALNICQRIVNQLEIPVVYLTDYGDATVMARARKTGSYGYIRKPIHRAELQNTLELAIQRHRADKRTKEAETAYRQLLENLGEGVFTATIDGAFLDANPAMAELAGYQSVEEFMASSVQRLFCPTDHREIMAELARKGSLAKFRVGLVTRDGTNLSVSLSAFVDRDDDGTPCRVTVAIEDVTAHEHLQEAFLEIQHKLHTVFEASPAAIIIVDPEGRIVLGNHRMADLFSLRVEDLQGTPYIDLVHPEQRAVGYSKMKSLMAGEIEHVSMERHYLAADGRTFWGHLSGRRLVRADGRLVGLLGIITDITDIKNIAHDLRASEELYRALVETTDTGYVVLDDQGRVLDANAEYVRLTGRNDLEEIRGCSVIEWTADHDKQRNALEVEQCLRKGYVRNLEIDYVGPEGRAVPVEINASVIRDTRGTRIVTLCRAIIERKRTEGLLRDLRDLGETLSGMTDLQEGLYLCLDNAVKLSGIQSAGIYMVGKDENLRLVAHRGLTQEFSERVKFLPKGSPEVRMIALGESIYYDGSLPKFSPWLSEAIQHEGYRGSAAIPILNKGQVIGSLNVCSREYETIPLDLKHVLEMIASGIGLALARISEDEELRRTKEALQAFFDASSDVFALLGQDCRFLMANRYLSARLGLEPEEFVGKTVFDLLPPEQAAPKDQMLRQVLETGKPVRFEHFRNEAFFDSILHPVADRNGETYAVALVGRDITERKRAEEALRASEERFRLVYESNMLGMGLCGPDGGVLDANDAYLTMIKRTREDLLNGLIDWKAITPPEHVPSDLKGFEQLITTGRCTPYEKEYLLHDGTRVPVIIGGALLSGSTSTAFAFALDITERKEAENRLKRALQEKEVLLREVHHRVKNNLAVVSSLIGLQSRHAKDPYHRGMFMEAKDRIRAMALAHEKLYQSPSLAEVNVEDYLGSLIQHLMTSLGHVGWGVDVVKEIADLSMDLDAVAIIGLIVNELITNSIKHAFPDRSSGRLTIALKEVADNTLELRVADDGVGLPTDAEIDKGATFGLSLVRIFASQLGGRLEVRRDKGTDIRLIFRNGDER